MQEKVILRSMTVDHHGDFIPLKMMEDYVNTINGNYKMRYLINHRTVMSPLGYFDNTEIKEIDKAQKQMYLQHFLKCVTRKHKTIISYNLKDKFVGFHLKG